MTLNASEAAIEAEIKTKGLNAPRVTPAQIDATILAEQFFVPPGTTLTICVLTLQNGFNVTGESAAASPENFDEAIGRRIARENARNKIWPLEGYLLRAKLSAETRHTTAAIEMAARVAHEVNRAYCASIGDTSQPAWADAPEWQRQSAINGVKFTLASPTATPERSHESWLTEKAADGWKFGPVKNPEAKEHPCFVPYGELPAAQRVKDYLFLAVVRSLAA
jgi:hypothetical protein